MFPEARIPYGTWGASFFPAWQTSALAEVNIGQFAGEAMNRIFGKRKVPKDRLEYLVIGSTVPWHWTGCSLVRGHPQGPTLTRLLIEALEEAVDLGGGHVLLFGCAAGDVGIAALFKVSEVKS